LPQASIHYEIFHAWPGQFPKFTELPKPPNYLLKL